jgi:hypothetical protein
LCVIPICFISLFSSFPPPLVSSINLTIMCLINFTPDCLPKGN